MAAVGEDDSSLATQCMAFCRALTGQGKVVQFSLNIGSTFSFTLDTRCKEIVDSTHKKKVSPSTLKRNAKRRAEFLKRKSQPAQEQENISVEKEPASQHANFQCDQCDHSFKTEAGLKIHTGKAHKLPPAERVRDTSSAPSLSMSPVKDNGRIVPCHMCGEEMSPQHTCDVDEQSRVNSTFMCYLCQDTFNSEEDLENHYNVKHPNQCRDCKACMPNQHSFFCANYVQHRKHGDL